MYNFTIQFTDKKPMYLQLYEFIKENIKNKTLKYDDKLPSKRRLSAHLNISKNTVENAYNQLLLEGYIISKERKGYFVNKTDNFMLSKNTKTQTTVSKKENILYDFHTEKIATDIFPYSTWTRIHKQVMCEKNDLLFLGNGNGDEELRNELVSFLYEYRGITATPQQIIIGAGIEYLISLLAEMLNTYEFYMEHFHSDKLYQILKNQNVSIQTFDVSEMNNLILNQTGVLYLTGSHQFPFGNPLSLENRRNISKWLQKNKAYVIEDDYNYEFTYNTKPLPALYSLNKDQVIYLSTFSRSIAPSLRIAFMVLPESLLHTYENRYGCYSNPVSRLEQQSLYRFIHDGHYSRHLNRIRNYDKQLKKELIEYISNKGDYLEVYNSDGASFLTLKMNSVHYLKDLELLENNGIRFYPSPISNLIYMGYAGYTLAQLKEAINLIYKIKRS